jgi:hypothetical protein
MPNHVKNKIELIGEESSIEKILDQFGTHVPEKYNKAHDGAIICRKKNSDEFNVGWFDEESNEFRTHYGGALTTAKGLPEGWEFEINESFLHFPDFNKVIPQPEELNIESSSTGDMGLFVLTGKNGNMFMTTEEQMKRFWELDEKIQDEALKLGRIYANNIKKYGHQTWYGWNNDNWGTKWNSYSCDKISDNIFTFETAWSNVKSIIEKISKTFPDIIINYTWADEDIGANCGLIAYKDGILSENIPETGSKEAYDIAFLLRPENKEYYEFVNGEYKYIEE